MGLPERGTIEWDHLVTALAHQYRYGRLLKLLDREECPKVIEAYVEAMEVQVNSAKMYNELHL